MIGNRLKQLREEKGMKQEELAKCLSVSPSAIGMYERNAREPNNALTLKICKLFNCSVDYLMGNSDSRTVDDLVEEYLQTQYQIDVNNAMMNTDVLFVSDNIDISFRKKIKNILLDNSTDDVKKHNLDILINSFSGNKKKR